MRGVIDWVSVFQEYGVAYRARGANVAAGNLVIHCPWCGRSDPSMHMGVSLKGEGWGCWRNSKHRGRHPSFLLRQLIGPQETTLVLRKYNITHMGNAWQDATHSEVKRPARMEWPDGIFDFNVRVDARFEDYLHRRGFAAGDIQSLWMDWGLRCGRVGHYSGRLIIPYYVDNRPVWFTGRAISNSETRYRSQPHDTAVVDPKAILFHHDAIESPGGIIVCEGPLDAIKVSMYGPLPGVGLSTNHATDAQLKALARASRVYLILDNDNSEMGESQSPDQALTLYYELLKLGVPTRIVTMPGGYKDLAEIPHDKFAEVLPLEKLTGVH